MGISVKEIIAGLEDGSIVLDKKGHLTNSVIDNLERVVEFTESMIEKRENNEEISNFYKSFIENIKIGVPIHDTYDNYCFNCGGRNSLVMIDAKTLGFFNVTDFNNLGKENGKDFTLSPSDFQPCKATPLIDAGKLTATINVPTGKLVFDNFFITDSLYDMKEEGYHSINDIMGRNQLMQHLASKNVGYGQLGNMSVNVYYSKEKEEILIGDPYIEDQIEDLRGFIEECPDEARDENRKRLKELETVDLKVFEGFDLVGDICCDVWRWQCADQKTLDDAGDEQRYSAFTVEVSPGDWEIEHYYEFQKREAVVYSRIKLKS